MRGARRGFAVLAAILAAILVALVGVVLWTSPAAADSQSEFPGCRYEGDIMTTDTGLGYGASGWRYKPGWSGCEDINVTTGLAGMTVRVRFCPSNGSPCYPNSWKGVCTYCHGLAATDVLPGTLYRLEIQTTRTYFMDAWD